MKTRVKVFLVLSWALLIGSTIGWPLSAVTWAGSEAPTILGLSWGAMIIASYGNIVAADIRREQEQQTAAILRELRELRELVAG